MKISPHVGLLLPWIVCACANLSAAAERGRPVDVRRSERVEAREPGRRASERGVERQEVRTSDVVRSTESGRSRLIDESARPLSPRERNTAEYLAERGDRVQSLREDHSVPGRKGDVVLNGRVTEFKSLESGATDATIRNTINNSIRRGGQARDIVIDARGSGLTVEAAQTGLARASGITRGRVDSVRIIGDKFDITSRNFE